MGPWHQKRLGLTAYNVPTDRETKFTFQGSHTILASGKVKAQRSQAMENRDK